MKRYLDFVNGVFTNKLDGVRPDRYLNVYFLSTVKAMLRQVGLIWWVLNNAIFLNTIYLGP